MDLLHKNPFFVNIVNMTSKSVSMPSFMIIAYASSVPTFIIHTRGGEPDMLTDDGSIQM